MWDKSMRPRLGAARGRLASVFTALTVLAIVSALAPVASGQAVPLPPFKGSATGTVVHADALQSGNTRLVDVEVAYSGSSVNTQNLTTEVSNEMQRIVQPKLETKNTYGRGSGVEVGLAVAPSGENQIIQAGKAEASALPQVDLVTKQIGPVAVSPLLWAGILRGEAMARYDTDPCSTLGSDLSYGLGYAADVQALDSGAKAETPRLDTPVVALDHPSPARGVSQSMSHNYLIPQVGKDAKLLPGGGNAFGLMSEIRMTIAPVTLFTGTSNQLTIEVLGEWVLQVWATGLAGGAFVHYGPREVTPETPILRTINAAGAVTNILTFQQVFGQTGFTTINVPGVVEIAIGEDPRMIGGDAASQPAIAANGTNAAAAVDVVRVKLLEQKTGGNVTARAADLRIGHMEASATVPAGGILCPIPVTKVPNPPEVSVGSTFVTTITILNPFDCTLVDVKLTDTITVENAARFRIEGTNPPADTKPSGEALSSGQVIWNNLGEIPPGGSKSVTVTLLAQGGAGRILDEAKATGALKCPPVPANAAGGALANARVAGVALGVVPAVVGASLPVKVPVAQVKGLLLANTGPSGWQTGLFGLGLATAGAAMFLETRRRRSRHPVS